MNIDFINNHGEWLNSDNPFYIVISTRVRLARNLREHIFPTFAKQDEKRQISQEIKASLDNLSHTIQFNWYELENSSALDRKLLLESHLISRELADGKGERAVAFDNFRTLAIMVNEEDHLRFQCIKSGLNLDAAFSEVDKLENLLSKSLNFAFDENYGYLTSCPTNIGTGLRASVMLHLPALVMTKHIDKAIRAIHEMQMAVRGFYGEGTEALGDLYQISNQITYGKSEQEIIKDLEAVISSLISYEEKARAELLTNNRIQLEDRLYRSLSLLKNSRLISSEEAMLHLSSLRLAKALGLIDLDISKINYMFLFSQSGHLQHMNKKNLAPASRDELRANFLRKELNSFEIPNTIL